MKNKPATLTILTIALLCVAIAMGGCSGPRTCHTGNTVTAVTSSAQSGKLFDYREKDLSNGLKVITLEDFTMPVVAVQVFYHVGSKNEQPGRHGFAHMFEHMMFRGTDKLGPTDFFDLVQRVGGECNGNTGFDRTVYLETLPANQVELALWLEAERMTFLDITQKNFDTERKVVEEERRLGVNKPYGTVAEKAVADLFTSSPYRTLPIGNIADLRAASVQELRAFWTKYYVPDNAVLVIVGAVKHEDAQNLAERYFGWIPRYPAIPPVNCDEAPLKAKSVVIKENNAPAPVVGMAWRTIPATNDDSAALDLLSQVMGGGNSSRLYRSLVAEKGLAVEAEAFSWSLEKDGIFGAGAVLMPGTPDPNAAAAAMRDVITDLRTRPVTDRELMKARNQMLKGLITANLKVESRANELGTAATILGDPNKANQQLALIRKVTAADIQRVASLYLPEDHALSGMIVQKSRAERAAAEAEPNVTAKSETTPPKPGRDDLKRPAGWPEKAPLKPVTALSYNPRYCRTVLPNGLTVMVVPNHSVPFVSMHLGLLGGAWTEKMPGSASMAMQMLLKGTQGYSEAQLADELETYAISLNASGSMDTADVSADCLTEYVPKALGLMGEVVLRPTFPEDQYVKLRDQVLTSLAVEAVQPEYLAGKETRKRLNGDHPYARSAQGEPSDVEKLTTMDLRMWWSRFVRPDMATLIFAGDIDEAAAVKLAKETFGDWQAVGPRPQTKLPPLPKVKGVNIYLVDMPGSTQSQIRVSGRGITRKTPGYFTSRVISSYFGWGFNSRLNTSIRVEKGLTYSVSGSFMANRFAGVFSVSTFSKTGTTPQTVQAVLDEIKRLRDVPPTAEEVEVNRSYITGNFIIDRETPQAVAGDLWMVQSQDLGSDYLSRLLKGIATTTVEDCRMFTARYVNPNDLVVVVVGDAGKLKDGLSKIAPVTVVSAESDKPEVSGSNPK
jgi:zinc protease